MLHLRVAEHVYRRRLERMAEMLAVNAPAILIRQEAKLIYAAHEDETILGCIIRYASKTIKAFLGASGIRS